MKLKVNDSFMHLFFSEGHLTSIPLENFTVGSCENGIGDSIPILIPIFLGTGSRIFERELM